MPTPEAMKRLFYLDRGLKLSGQRGLTPEEMREYLDKAPSQPNPQGGRDAFLAPGQLENSNYRTLNMVPQDMGQVRPMNPVFNQTPKPQLSRPF